MFQEQPPYVFHAWPAWRYGPDGEAAIFDEHDVVPEGWTATPQPEKSHEEESADAESPSEAADAGQEGQEEGQVLRRRGRPPKVNELSPPAEELAEEQF